MAKVTLAFSVDSNQDSDIVSWWEKMGNQGVNRSAVMRAAVRTYKDTADLTLVDIFNKLEEIRHMLRNGTGVPEARNPEAAQESADPLTQEAQDALNALGAAK